KELRRLETYPQPRVGPARAPSTIPRPVLAPNGCFVAAWTESSRSIHLWALGTGKRVRELRVPELVFASGNLAFSGDGELLAFQAGDQRFHLWSVPAAKKVFTPSHQPSGQLSELTLSANGTSLAGIWYGSEPQTQRWVYQLQAWDTRT